MKTVGIGLLGAGVVGGSLIRRLVEEHAAIEAKTGLDLELRKVAVRDLEKARGFVLDPTLLTLDPGDVIDDPNVGPAIRTPGAEGDLGPVRGPSRVV